MKLTIAGGIRQLDPVSLELGTCEIIHLDLLPSHSSFGHLPQSMRCYDGVYFLPSVMH